ncbi:MAG: hypothetical protein NTW87_30015 [Planctomycetota bacterium]|nr:hypothetical protein [Planctomycetota bacterium]
MQPLEFLHTAEDLWRNGIREADWRSSISRSYYAVYWMIGEEFLKTMPLILLQSVSLARKKDHLVHEKLPMVLKGSSDAKIQELGEALENLRLARVKADYHLASAISQVKAEDEYGNATDLRDELQKYGVLNLATVVQRDLQTVHGVSSPPKIR